MHTVIHTHLTCVFEVWQAVCDSKHVKRKKKKNTKTILCFFPCCSIFDGAFEILDLKEEKKMAKKGMSAYEAYKELSQDKANSGKTQKTPHNRPKFVLPGQNTQKKVRNSHGKMLWFFLFGYLILKMFHQSSF